VAFPSERRSKPGPPGQDCSAFAAAARRRSVARAARTTPVHSSGIVRDLPRSSARVSRFSDFARSMSHRDAVAGAVERMRERSVRSEEKAVLPLPVCLVVDLDIDSTSEAM